MPPVVHVYSIEQKKFLVTAQINGASGRQARERFREEFPNTPVPSLSTVQSYFNKYNTTGCFNHNHQNPESLKRPGHAKLTEAMRIAICASVEVDPHTTSRKIAKDFGLSQPSVLKVLKKNGYHSYKIKSGQILNEADYPRRLEMCRQFINRFDQDPNWKKRILWSDECTFFLDGKRNVQHLRTWARENPRELVATHSQYQQKLNVWAGIIDDKIIGPFFIEGNLTAEKYQAMLLDDIGPALAELFPDEDEEIFFQQDGAGPHTALAVRDLLNEMFNRRWIGRFSPEMEWSSRSPDMTPLDFWFWPYVKDKLYSYERIQSLAELRQNILQICSEIPNEMIRKVTNQGVERRMRACIQAEGRLFEHLLR